MNEQEVISKYHSELGKQSYKKSPRSKEFYQKMQKKSVKKRKQNQLSTDQ